MTHDQTPLGPILLELLYHKFKATTEEMGIALGRTARSSYVRETHDFATALCSPSGRFFAYPAETGISLCMDQDCSAFIAAVPDLEPGDILVTNHPYLAPGVGSHLPDINLLKPYFHDGELICFGWSFAHCADIGGGVPSSISPSFDNLFQEGLQIPPLKLARRGELSDVLLGMLRANSRIPDVILGDLQAQLSALAVGERRIAELIRQHGVDVVRAAQDGLVAYGKTRARDAQRRIPDGTYEFHDYMDDDFHTPIPVRMRCRMIVRDGEIHLDLTGTDPQLAAPYNVPTGGVRHPYLTSKLMHMLFTYDPELPRNYGIFENITVEVPRGTVMNPQSPAAVGVRHAGAIRFNDAVLGCLAQADPGLAPAASGGTVIPVVVAQQESGRQKIAVVQSLAGGAGATRESDGAGGRDRSLANINNTPTERSELDVAIRVERYELRTDSGGAGRYRGGAGVVFSLRALQDGLQVMGRGLERFVFQPWGSAGGEAGAAAQVLLNDGIDLGKIDRVQLNAGDVLTILTPGGGGYGNPFERDVVAVLDDVRLGFVSVAAARGSYGVVIDEATGALDQDATRAARSRPVRASRFGQVRDGWDRVFDDAAMTEFATLLLSLPAGAREAARRAGFERVVPGILTQGAALVCRDGFDVDAARARFAALRTELKGASHG
jgi:N-methylhydantoinase B